jgi:hypothetical protein
LRTYYLHQDPRASYEIAVDATSGDIGNPVSLERADPTGTVLQTALNAGSGPAQSLRWQNASSSSVSDQLIRVASTNCATNCGPDDQYRIRAYETTYAIARFNNTATQATVLVVQNSTNASVDLTVYFWDGAGALLKTVVPPALAAKSSYVLPTATEVPNLSGSITISNTAPYGRLSGKATALEPATGFAFDTLMEPRRR